MSHSDYFRGLNYSIGEEDTSIEHSLLPLRVGKVLTVAGGGSRVVPLLGRQPGHLICVDVSPVQLALTALRIELVRSLTHERYLAFMGYSGDMTAAARRDLFESLSLPGVHGAAARNLLASLHWGSPLYAGRFEHMLRSLHRVNACFTGPAGRRIFDFLNLPSQRHYYENDFPHRRWNAVLSLLGNATVFNQLLYKGAFPKNNTGVAPRLVYRRIFHSLFTTRLARSSFFLQMLFFGRLVFEEGFPLECRADVFADAKAALAATDIEYRLESVFESARSEREVDFVSLSDVPSFLSDEEGRGALAAVRPSLVPGATVVMRGHLCIVRPDSEGFADVSAQHAELLESESTGLWTFGVFRAC